ncbi:MAG: hypothetical protein ACOCYC_01370 [bacterium]
MKRSLFILVLSLGLIGVIAAQDTSNADRMIENFENAGKEVKVRILRTAQEEDVEGMGPLYRTALQYVVANSGDISGDEQLQELGRLSVEGIVRTGYSEAARDVWQLFENYQDTQARVQLLQALAAVDAEDRRLLPSLNDWVAERHNLKRSGSNLDERVLRAALETLGTYDDPSSFDLLLEAVLLQYSRNVGDTAESVLFELNGEAVQMATQAIRRRDAADKLDALDYLLDSDELSEEQKSEVALAALENALSSDPVDSSAREALRQVRYASAEWLRRTGYDEATPAMVRHFNQTFLDYDRGRIRKTWVLEAIAGLGAMDTEAAAERLTQFMDLLNTYTENDRAYDTQITLAVIENLEQLGYPIAYNALFYASLLDYPGRVKEAARTAMAALAR